MAAIDQIFELVTRIISHARVKCKRLERIFCDFGKFLSVSRETKPKKHRSFRAKRSKSHGGMFHVKQIPRRRCDVLRETYRCRRRFVFHVKHFGVTTHTHTKTARRVAARSKSGSYNVCAERMLAHLWSVTCISIASSCSVISQRALCPC